jgi:hypothetical protein
MAIHLYLENRGFKAIGRVLKWIRVQGEWIQAYHEQHKARQRPAVEVIELDELCHHVGSKKEVMGLACTGARKGRYT